MQEQHDLMMIIAFDGALIENPLPFSRIPRKNPEMLTIKAEPMEIIAEAPEIKRRRVLT